MAVDHIRYDILAQEALRGVVRAVLRDAAKDGLPGEPSLLHFLRYPGRRGPALASHARAVSRGNDGRVAASVRDLLVTEEASRSASPSAAFPSDWLCRSRRSRRIFRSFGAVRPAVRRIQEAVDKKREGRRSRATKTDQDSTAGRRRGERRLDGDNSAPTPPALATPPTPANPELTATSPRRCGQADRRGGPSRPVPQEVDAFPGLGAPARIVPPRRR